MARWRLTAKHYLNVPDMEWEYKETTAEGRQHRKIFIVPRYLNPDDPSDWTEGNDCVVCLEGKGHRKDIVFLGDPTPDMEPLDPEAEEISNSLRPSWQHPIDSLPGQGVEYGDMLLEKLTAQIDALASGRALPNTSAAQVSVDQFAALQAQVAQLTEMNARLLEQMAATQAEPKAEKARRV